MRDRDVVGRVLDGQSQPSAALSLTAPCFRQVLAAIRRCPVATRQDPRLGALEEGGDLVAFLASDQASFLTGQIGMAPRRRLGTPEDIGDTVLYLASRAASSVAGVVIPLEGGVAL